MVAEPEDEIPRKMADDEEESVVDDTAKHQTNPVPENLPETSSLPRQRMSQPH